MRHAPLIRRHSPSKDGASFDAHVATSSPLEEASSPAVRRAGASGASSDRQRDFPHETGENEQAAQAVAVALVGQKEAGEADEGGDRHRDLTSSVHVLFPRCLPPINLARDDRFRSLPEAFVIGGIRLGRNKNKARIK